MRVLRREWQGVGREPFLKNQGNLQKYTKFLEKRSLGGAYPDDSRPIFLILR